jgi:hypothetical protein
MVDNTSMLHQKFCAVDPGKVVILEAERPLTYEESYRIRQMLKHAVQATGVKFVLLPHGIKVAKIEEQKDEQAG